MTWNSACLVLAVALQATSAQASGPEDGVTGDRIEGSLTGEPGEATRGRAIVVDRRKGLCLLCHTGPFPEERFQGNLAPDLAGAGDRWSEAQLRLRMVDARRLAPEGLMPAFHSTAGLSRVGPAWRDQPILNAGEVEDVVAFLTTLKARK